MKDKWHIRYIYTGFTAITVKKRHFNNMEDEIALAVKTYRKANGLTQAELADLAGVGKTSVFDIEKGKASVQFDTLLAILQALNIEIKLIPPFPINGNNK